MCHIFFIPSSINGWLGCFHVLAIINSAAMNIGVHVSLSSMEEAARPACTILNAVRNTGHIGNDSTQP